MATLVFKLICYLMVVVFVSAKTKSLVNNTIFADEKLKGGLFEYLDVYSNTDLLNTVHSDYRLPTTTRPVHYIVFWKIDIDRTLTFSGTVEILLVATQANVDEIVIHSASNLIRTSTVLMLGSETIPVTVEEEPEFDFLRIKLNSGTLQYDAATEVQYSLKISFNAPLETRKYGIYLDFYDDIHILEDGTITGTEANPIVFSQFKTSYARYALPCYDEPKFKASFDVVISRPAHLRSRFCSRNLETRATDDEAFQEDVYRRTPPIPTHLLALGVFRFNSVFDFHPDNSLKHEIFYRSSRTGSSIFVFELGYKSIEKMSEHTGIDYYDIENMRKMTHVVLPDFTAGVTEGWGLIMSREAFSLYDAAHTSDYYRQLMATNMGNQISHIWFSGIVTNEFWDSLWLHEGFARYYQYFLAHLVDQQWSVSRRMGFDTRFIPEQVHTGLLSDSADYSHPLTNPNVGSPASIDAMFTTITTSKGASVIRMTEHLLGFEVHRQGLQNYLKNRYFSTARPNDLFEALQEIAVTAGAIAAYGSDFSVIDYYRSWTEKGGHPVVFVNVNHSTGDMIIQQRRFNINTGYSSDGSHWIIPITFATATNPDFANTKPSHIISQPVTVINRGTVGDAWVIFNKQQTGFYRVNYDEYTWNLIVLALRGDRTERTVIHEYNRAQIVDDVFQFARSGIMSYTRAFNILSFLEKETEYTPWVAAMTGFTWLRNRLAGTPELAALDRLIIRWATPILHELSYYPVLFESFMRSYLRWQLAPMMCAMNVRACRNVANIQFRELVDNSAEVPINSRKWVYCNGLRDGSEADFDFLWQRYQDQTLENEKLQILESLGCTPHASRIISHLNNIVQDNDLIKKLDYTLAFNSVLTGNEENTKVVLAYIQDNLSAVINAFGSADVLSNVAARLRTLEDVNEFQSWVTANRDQLGDAYDTIVANAELSRQSILWATQVRDDMNNYFANGDDELTASTSTPVTNPTTVSRPELENPETPDIPGSAVTAFLSLFTVLFTACANFVL